MHSSITGVCSCCIEQSPTYTSSTTFNVYKRAEFIESDSDFDLAGPGKCIKISTMSAPSSETDPPLSYQTEYRCKEKCKASSKCYGTVFNSRDNTCHFYHEPYLYANGAMGFHCWTKKIANQPILQEQGQYCKNYHTKTLATDVSLEKCQSYASKDSNCNRGLQYFIYRFSTRTCNCCT